MKQHIAVLGAGLTGLSSAFHLSRIHPNVKITVIERQRKAGGWVRSSRVPLPEKHGDVLLEAGPRTLRPNAQSVLELVHLLGLKDDLITVPKDSPAAQSRFLFTPATGLEKIPSSLISLLRSPLTRILVPAVVKEALKSANRPKHLSDESVHSFLERRFGAQFAQVFGSAIIHGIYAADSRSISVRAAFPTMWEAEERGWGGLVRGMFIPAKKPAAEPYDVGDISMKDVSVYSFKDGMQTLTDALEARLNQNPNVEIIHSMPVRHIQDGFRVEFETGDTLSASHVVSALPTPALHGILPGNPHLGPLLVNSTSSVHVVNIVFPGPPCSIHPAGFGYLIPRTQSNYSTPSSHNPLGMLGTVFDSCSLAAQDTDSPDPYHTSKFTKLTVIIGGPYPLPLHPPQLSSATNDTTTPPYIQNLLTHLSVHLGCDLPPPLFWRIVPNNACIPTLAPGHLDRMDAVRKWLDARYDGKLQAVGAGIGGVSLGDCVEAGRRVAKSLRL